jgi:hypothetical protein
MNEVARQVGRTVRAALGGWGPAIRLCLILVVAAAAFYLVSAHR